MHFKLHLVHFTYLTLVLSCINQPWQCFVACEKHAENDGLEKPQPPISSSTEGVASPVNDDADAQVEILPNYKKIRKYEDYESVAENAETKQTPPRTHSDEMQNIREKDTSVLNLTEDTLESVQSEKTQTIPIKISVVPDAGNRPDANNNNNNLNKNVADSKVKLVKENTLQEVPNDIVNEKNNNKRFSDNYLDDNVTTKYTPKTTAEGRRLLKETQNNDGLPEIITEVPRVTLTELPMDFVVVEPQENVHDTLIFDDGQGKDKEQHAKQTNETNESDYDKSNGSAQKDEQILKINDPGGGVDMLESESSGESNIPMQVDQVAAPPGMVGGIETHATGEAGVLALRNDSTGAGGAADAVNLTVEEVPIPVFSEWAQKQMEAEASKMQALEQEQLVVNNSAQRRNNTHVNGKSQTLKMRSKNYASPDCGAKIIASNPGADHTGAVLTQSRDEYMLNPCGERIWFVVELCEAIQAQKIELANFELFSSSPKNFTVAVSNRFPTRDWSNVGHFTAEDKRTVQSFDLHPHLFGKFVRVDIHSHYSKEHFCPVSLFRAFGTSEIEAFETEIGASNDLDDFDDEEEPAQAKRTADNIFKSASDAVLQMVKKAAEVLAKPTATHALHKPTKLHECHTPAFGQYSCDSCKNSTLVARINAVLSCELQQLQVLLSVAQLRAHLQQTRTCIDDYSVVVPPPTLSQLSDSTSSAFVMHKKQSYFLNILPAEYIGALCKLMSELDAHKSTKMYSNNSLPAVRNANNVDTHHQSVDLITNNDNRTKSESIGTAEQRQRVEKPTSEAAAAQAAVQVECTESNAADAANQSAVASVTDEQTANNLLNTLKSQNSEIVDDDVGVVTGHVSMVGSPAINEATTTTTKTATATATAPDVNIFNVPAVEPEIVVANVLPPITPQVTEIVDDNVQPKENVDAAATTTTAGAAAAATATTDATITESTPIIQTPTTASTTTSPPQQQHPPPPQPPTASAPARNSDEEAANWEGIDNLLTTTVASITASGSAAAAAAGVINNSNNNNNNNMPTGNGVNMQQKISNGAQSESVFIRLSNRVKALERNMSLSGQYLEELSRRYKKQVEELQQTLTQQTLTVRTLEEQSRRYAEQKQLYMEQNAELSNEVRSLAFQVQFCFGIVLFVGTCILLLVVLGYIYYRKLRRQTQELVLLNAAGKSKPIVLSQRKLNRRKSFEDFSDHQQNVTIVEKQRRPSEEAMLILKECGDVSTTKTELGDTSNVTATNKTTGQALSKRQRKISVCYGSNNNINAGVRTTQGHNAKRKGAKHSWHGIVDKTAIERDADKYFDTDTFSSSLNLKSTQATLNGASYGKPKKKTEAQQQQHQQQQQQQPLKRQKSAPGQIDNNTTAYDSPHSDFEEQLLLDDEDLDNFIPNSDLAYNEFMPEGPSGYQIVDTPDNVLKKSNKNDNKKSRRLSSPAFLKSAFGKSKSKQSTAVSKPKAHPVHEPTSWEWYRLKCSNEQQDKHREKSHTATSNTPTASLDSSSLSEINFPTNSTQNSFRILEEAILSSGENIATSRSNTNGSNGKVSAAASSSGNSSSSSGGGSSNRSTSSTGSSNAKKKSRTFNKIFRNVF